MPRSPRPELRILEPALTLRHPSGWTACSWPPTGAAPHELVALRLPVAPEPGEVFMREGWQSWSTPLLARVGTGLRREPPARPVTTGRRHWLPDPPYRGDEAYFVWRSASTTAHAGRHEVVFVAGEDGLLAVREEPAGGEHPLVWCAPRAVEAPELAARLASEVVPPAHTGWSTWHARGPALTGADLLGDLAELDRAFGDSVQSVTVDDGWQRAMGDWAPRDAAMARAIAEAAAQRELTLWWAPFAALPGTVPDSWLLPALVPARVPSRALDLSHPDVVDRLAATAARLVDLGATRLKCDHLYASACTGDAARAGRCADPSVTGEEAHRRALAAIRGAGAAVIGCGAPLGASAGLVDVMRVGPDTGPHWGAPVPPGLEPQDAGGGIANAWSAAHRRHWMDGALWRNDPDSVFLRAGPAGEAWLAWVAARGLPLVLGDRLGELTADDRRRWARAVDRRRTALAGIA